MSAFVVDGEEYEIIEDVTLKEAAICEKHLGFSVAGMSGLTVVLVSMFISALRKTPGADPADVAERVGAISLVGLELKEDEPSPPGDGGDSAADSEPNPEPSGSRPTEPSST
jgi:hypothetical protein